MAQASTEKYKVPNGLRPLLEALARETLRAQPTDLISFSQLFFDELQRHRSQCRF
uniref:RIIa domain-containing protein n=1 Tax=Ascaris lumbricoides TaxID=6252 RepID=A0A0M3HWE4_ASCLU